MYFVLCITLHGHRNALLKIHRSHKRLLGNPLSQYWVNKGSPTLRLYLGLFDAHVFWLGISFPPPFRHCRPAKQDPAVQACDCISSPHCFAPNTPHSRLIAPFISKRKQGRKQPNREVSQIKRPCFLDTQGCMCDISSACVWVPKIIFIDGKGVQRGWFCQSAGMRWKKKKRQRKAQSKTDSSWCQAVTAHGKSEEKERSSFFRPQRALHILQIVGWLVWKALAWRGSTLIQLQVIVPQRRFLTVKILWYICTHLARSQTHTHTNTSL